MERHRIDSIARFFAGRRISRRQALRGGAGVVAAATVAGPSRQAAAQEATPAANAGEKRQYLFLQSFRRGNLVPQTDGDEVYTLTLEQGLGQTIYFSDRPDRIVGAVPTDRFLAGLGFPEDNPPNAALVVDDPDGTTDIAVLVISRPVFDPASPGVTYDVRALKQWERTLDVGFTERPTDLAGFPAEFDGAHLFIDDCPDASVICNDRQDGHVGDLGPMGYCWAGELVSCVPCEGTDPFHQVDFSHLKEYWRQRCEASFSCPHGCEPTRVTWYDLA